MDNVVSGLMEMGLSEREAKLYMAMLKAPDSTATDLQRLSGISRTKIYEILNRMAEHKLCVERQIGSVKRYTPVNPRLMADLRKESMSRQLQQIDSLKEQLAEIYDQSQSGPISFGCVELLKSRDQIAERLKFLLENCSREELAFSKPPFVLTVESSDEDTQTGLKRIEVVRSVYEYGIALDAELWKAISRWHEAGEQQRFVPILPNKMFIFDSFYVILSIHDPARADSKATLLISDREVALAFRMLFEHVWNDGLTYEEYAANSLRLAEEARTGHTVQEPNQSAARRHS
jgi:sugar-specific transcriptional regulator TrmB